MTTMTRIDKSTAMMPCLLLARRFDRAVRLPDYAWGGFAQGVVRPIHHSL